MKPNMQEENLIDKMATIGLFPDGEYAYKLAVHGCSSNGCQTVPHLHVFPNTGNSDFDLEFSLLDLLVRDKWVRLSVRGTIQGKQIIDMVKTENWQPYTQILIMLQEFIFEKNYEVGGINYIDPLHYAVVSWNKEYDFSAYRRKENSLFKFIEKSGMKILPKYQKYFE